MYTALPPLFGPIVGVTGGERLATPLAQRSAYSPSRSSTAKAMCAVPGLALPLSTASASTLRYSSSSRNTADPGILRITACRSTVG
jgi:hypothetical protein